MPEGFTVGFFVDCDVDTVEATPQSLVRIEFHLRTAIPMPPKSFRPGPQETVAVLLLSQDAEELAELLSRVLERFADS